MEQIQIGDLVLTVAPDVAESSQEGSAFPTSKPKRKVEPRRNVQQSKLILAIAKKHGFENVRQIGYGALPDQPLASNGWLVMPRQMYKGIIPPHVLQQAEILTKGIPIKGFIVADDQRHIEQERKNKVAAKPVVTPDWRKIAATAGKAAAVAAVGAAVVAALPVVLGIGLIGATLVYDPLLIAVTAEDEWIVVGEWWD
jgi:hypothetical protein